MAPKFLYLTVIQTIIVRVATTFPTSPYVQYAAAYPSPAYITSYPAQSYTTGPAPVYAPSFPPPTAIYQQAYVQAPASPVLGSPSNYAPPSAGYQPTFTKPPAAAAVGTLPSHAPTTAAYQPAYTKAPATAAIGPLPSYVPPTTEHRPTYVKTPPPPPPPPPPSTYQTTAYQQPLKASPVIPPKAPLIPNVDPIMHPTPYVSLETLPKSKLNPSPKSDASSGYVPPFDSNVLNNLAIALQLLIVSNLIHNPPLDTRTVSDLLDEDILPTIAPFSIPLIVPSPPELSTPSYSQHYYDGNLHNPYYSIPNANFLGSSGFGDIGMSKTMMSAYGSPTPAKPRSMGLKSPYDVIATSVHTADTASTSTSPYNLNSDYNTLFSLSELFKVN